MLVQCASQLSGEVCTWACASSDVYLCAIQGLASTIDLSSSMFWVIFYVPSIRVPSSSLRLSSHYAAFSFPSSNIHFRQCICFLSSRSRILNPHLDYVLLNHLHHTFSVWNIFRAIDLCSSICFASAFGSSTAIGVQHLVQLSCDPALSIPGLLFLASSIVLSPTKLLISPHPHPNMKNRKACLPNTVLLFSFLLSSNVQTSPNQPKTLVYNFIILFGFFFDILHGLFSSFRPQSLILFLIPIPIPIPILVSVLPPSIIHPSTQIASTCNHPFTQFRHATSPHRWMVTSRQTAHASSNKRTN